MAKNKNITAEEIVDGLANKLGVSREDAISKMIEFEKELAKLKNKKQINPTT